MFRFSGHIFLLFLVLIAGTVACSAGSAAVPGPAVDSAKAAAPGQQTVVIAGGCFWGIQAVFQHVKGVISATSGYSGGEAKTAQYEMVSTGETGHAESVKITYDPSQITYGELLRVFFSVAHDPTQLNRQGPDDGTQYRSVIFYGNDEQKKDCGSVHRAARQGQSVSASDRDPGGAAEGVLSGGGLSPGLCDASSGPALHRL